MLALLVPIGASIVTHWLVWRRIKARGHYVVTIGGPNSGRCVYVPPKDPK